MTKQNTTRRQQKRVINTTEGEDNMQIDPVDLHVGKMIRTTRIMRGLTQEELGNAVGVTFQQIQKYERGTNRVSASRMYALTRALEINVEDMFSGFGNQRTASPLCSPEIAEAAVLLVKMPQAQRDALLAVIKVVAHPFSTKTDS